MSALAWLKGIFVRPGGRAEAAGPAPTVGYGDGPANVSITPALLRALGTADPDAWAPPLAEHMRTHGILANKQRAAMFLANVINETGGFKRLVESLDYSPQRMAEIWPSRYANQDGTPNPQAVRLGRTVAHPADQRAIAEASYGGRFGNTSPGDGWKYRGRGLMQTAFRANYEAAARFSGLPLVERPEMLEQMVPAVQSACYFWAANGCNDVADRGDLTGVRKIVNGGAIGLAEVRGWYARVLAAL